MSRQIRVLIKNEIRRQNETLDFIASENIAHPDMFRILGSPLVNKYSEGYPGARYYPGNQYYDEIEVLAQKNALQAFKLSKKTWSVNVQPHSGSLANHAVYFALLKPGETMMGLELSHGGHLTHGSRVSFSGMYYHSVTYGVNVKTGLIDYDALLESAKKHRPKIIISGASAYPRKIDFKRIQNIAKSVGAYHVADISHIAGLVVAGLHQSPFPYADVVTMTTHKTLRGPRGAVIFSRNTRRENEDFLSSRIDKAVFPGLQGGPHNNTIAAIAWMFEEVQKKPFFSYAKQTCNNAIALSDALRNMGFLITTNGTDNHLFLMDVRPFDLTGKDAEELLEGVGVLANRNTLPDDKSARLPSGVRFGTASVTARGMKERDMLHVASCINAVLKEKKKAKSIAKDIKKIARNFPLSY